MEREKKARILLVNAKGAESRDVEKLVESASHIMVDPVSTDQVRSQLAQGMTDVIIVNAVKIDTEETDLLAELRADAPNIPVIVTTETLSPEETRRLLTYRIHDWLPRPLSGDELLASIRKGLRTTKTTSNRVHAVISCVGGAGGTTLAISMADLVASKMGKKSGSVALFDLDFSSGNCSFVLNQVSNFNLASVTNTPNRIDAEFISVIQQKHEQGFFLYSFKQPEILLDINGYELVLRMLDAVSLEHEHTILDIPYYAFEWRDEVHAAINTCTLVTELNLPAIKHTLDVMEDIRKQRGPDFPIQVVFNKWQTRLFGQRIGRKKLKELFGDTPIYSLPYDYFLMGESNDRGLTPSAINKRAGFVKKLAKYVREIKVMEVPAA